MLNQKIRALRLAKGLTLKQVGDVFGISRASVSAWESGTSKPDSAKLVRLAELLDTSVSNLLGETVLSFESLALVSKTDALPFVRWDMIESKPWAIDPTQQVWPSTGPVPNDAFATRFISPPDWNWQPGPIPGGALLIIAPCDKAVFGPIYLVSAKNQPLQLAALHSAQTFKSINHLKNSTNILINIELCTIIGELIEWQLHGRSGC